MKSAVRAILIAITSLHHSTTSTTQKTQLANICRFTIRITPLSQSPHRSTSELKTTGTSQSPIWLIQSYSSTSNGCHLHKSTHHSPKWLSPSHILNSVHSPTHFRTKSASTANHRHPTQPIIEHKRPQSNRTSDIHSRCCPCIHSDGSRVDLNDSLAATAMAADR